MKRCICINHADIYISVPDYEESISGGFGYNFGYGFGGAIEQTVYTSSILLDRLGDGDLVYNIETHDSGAILSPFITHPSIDNVLSISLEMNLRNFDSNAMSNYFGATSAEYESHTKTHNFTSVKKGQAIIDSGFIDVISTNLVYAVDYYIAGNQIIFARDIDTAINISYNVSSSIGYKILNNNTPKIFKIQFSGWNEISNEFVSLIIPRAEIKLNTTRIDAFSNEDCFTYNIIGKALMLTEQDKPIEIIRGNING